MKACPEFLKKMPELCGAGVNAARHSRVIELIFADEQVQSGKVFAENDDDKVNPDNRIAVLFEFPGNQNKKELCRDIVLRSALQHRLEAHGDMEYTDVIPSLTKTIDERLIMPENVAIAEAIAVETMSFWAN